MIDELTAIRKATASLRERNEPVPRPLRLPTEVEVDSVQRALGIPFPPEYRYFLLNASDVTVGAIEPAIVIPGSGHLDLVNVTESAWQAGVPQDHLPFCEDNGDYYCLTPDRGVVLWSHDGRFSGRWASLADWIQQVWLDGEGCQ